MVMQVLNQSLLRIDIFRYSMNCEVKDNLSEYALSTVSNMLALYYAADEKLQKIEPDIQRYANETAAKLARYLKEEVVLEESFDVAMNLFAIAIAPEMPKKETPPSLTQEKAAIIDVANNMCFNNQDISPSERQSLSEVLSAILDSPNSNEILDLISLKPQIVRALIRKRTKTQDIVSKLTDLANISGKATTISTDFMQFSGLIMCGLVGFASNLAAIHSMEAIAAVTVIPSSVIALKYGTQLGEAIGKKLASYETTFKEANGKFKEMMDNFTPDIKSLELVNEIKIEKAKSKDLDIADLKLDSVIKNVATHLSTQNDIENAKDIDIVKQKAKDMGHDAF